MRWSSNRRIITAAWIFAAQFMLANFGLQAAPLKITMAGDSTVAVFPADDYGSRFGWGQVLPDFFSTDIVVDDRASSGRSSKSFYDEGKWAACLLTQADFYFIQFGHNDSKSSDPARYTDPQTTFKDYLTLYINQARAANGIPVLLTPPTRRKYQSEHKLHTDSLQDYAQAMRELGEAMNVPVLDVLPASIEFYEYVGQTNAPFYQATIKDDSIPNQDATHFNNFGAEQHGYLVMDCLLNSTNTTLLPLQDAVRRKGVKLKVDLPTVQTIQYQGSTNLTNWMDYGEARMAEPPGVSRAFYDVREHTMFYQAVTN